MKIPKILNNKILCYALMVLAVLNVIGYITSSAWECLIVFLLAYYGADQYLGNMSASIIVALFASNFVFGCGRVKETFVENMKEVQRNIWQMPLIWQLKVHLKLLKKRQTHKHKRMQQKKTKHNVHRDKKETPKGKCEMKKAAAKQRKMQQKKQQVRHQQQQTQVKQRMWREQVASSE